MVAITWWLSSRKICPNGGPWGGDGGRGGNVIFVVDLALYLMDFRYNRYSKWGKRKTKGMHGREQKISMRVPRVRDVETARSLRTQSHGQEYIVAHGGRGGNIRFATPKIQPQRLNGSLVRNANSN